MAAAAVMAAIGGGMQLGQGLMPSTTKQVSTVTPAQLYYHALQANRAVQYMPSYYAALNKSIAGGEGAFEKLQNYANDYRTNVQLPGKQRYNDQLAQIQDSIHSKASDVLTARAGKMNDLQLMAEKQLGAEKQRNAKMTSDASSNSRRMQAAGMGLANTWTPMGQTPETMIRPDPNYTNIAAGALTGVSSIGQMIKNKWDMRSRYSPADKMAPGGMGGGSTGQSMNDSGSYLAGGEY